MKKLACYDGFRRLDTDQGSIRAAKRRERELKEKLYALSPDDQDYWKKFRALQNDLGLVAEEVLSRQDHLARRKAAA